MRKLLAAIGFVSLLAGVAAAQSSQFDLFFDAAFGNAGKVTTDFSVFGLARALAVAVQPDGKIVAAGRLTDEPRAGLAMARYQSDGSLDVTFGGSGTLVDYTNQAVRGVAVQFDGKIVTAGGMFPEDDPTSPSLAFKVTRYNRDGSIDRTFGDSGAHVVAFNGFDEQPTALGIQPDGKIVVAGWTLAPFGGGYDFAVARFNTDGSLDTTFGVAGTVTTDFLASDGSGADNYAYALGIQSDGKIVVGGVKHLHSNDDFALARYNSNGSLDGTFGDGGRVTTDFSDDDAAYAVAIQADGKIVAAGGGSAGPSGLRLARYNANGSLDTSFGNGGKVTSLNDATGLALQPDGRIVTSSDANGFVVRRFTSAGAPDLTFGLAGAVNTNFAGTNEARSVAVQSDGKIVAAGSTCSAGMCQFALARYSNTQLPPTLTFEPSTVRAGGSFVARFERTEASAYFDVRFRAPGSFGDVVVLNWQQGAVDSHVVSAGTALGTWTVTGLRPHINANDHGGEFFPVNAAVTVTP